MIKHVFLKSGHVENSSNSYLYLHHDNGFSTADDVFKDLHTVFVRCVRDDEQHEFGCLPGGTFCSECGLRWHDHQTDDLSEEIATCVSDFVTGISDGTFDVYQELDAAGWSQFLDIHLLNDGQILHVEASAEKFIAAGNTSPENLDVSDCITVAGE